MSSLIRFHGGTKQSITESPKILESCSFAWMRSFLYHGGLYLGQIRIFENLQVHNLSAIIHERQLVNRWFQGLLQVLVNLDLDWLKVV